MEVIPQKDWGEIGMAFSFLGREICRPSNPKCGDCVMNKVCEYYKQNGLDTELKISFKKNGQTKNRLYLHPMRHTPRINISTNI